MRKLLAQIVKDTTPGPGMRHPLSEQTIKDIRDCFGLISARERELAEQAGIENTEIDLAILMNLRTSKVIEFKKRLKNNLLIKIPLKKIESILYKCNVLNS